MMKSCVLFTAFSAVPFILCGCNSNNSTAKPADPAQAVAQQREPFSVLDAAELQLVAKVQSINYATRRVTLVDACGATMEFIASDQVRRLNEIKGGDMVKITSTVSVLAEVRPPTTDEQAHPIASTASGSRAGSGSPPAGSSGRGLRVVTTVQSADMQTMQVILKGPHGDTATIKARNPENVRRLHAGDTVVLTYTEAIAAEIVPAGQ